MRVGEPRVRAVSLEGTLMAERAIEYVSKWIQKTFKVIIIEQLQTELDSGVIEESARKPADKLVVFLKSPKPVRLLNNYFAI